MSARTKIVRHAHDALNRGDAEALTDLCAPDFRLDMSDRVFNPEVYSGHDGIRRFVAEVREVWETFTWEPTEMKEAGDMVLAVIHSVGRGRGSLSSNGVADTDKTRRNQQNGQYYVASHVTAPLPGLHCQISNRSSPQAGSDQAMVRRAARPDRATTALQ